MKKSSCRPKPFIETRQQHCCELAEDYVELIADLIDDTVIQVLGSLPRAKRRDPEALEQAVDRAVRGALRNVWGKKPACHVLVVEV